MEQQLSICDMIENRSKYVRRIDPKEAAPFIMEIHYARRMPTITDAFGLFLGGDLVGVVTYGVPASMPLCKGLAGQENFNNVRELNRLVIKPEINGAGGKNLASYLVSHSLKMLKNGTFVVSYADTAWSHVGYVYQACNFLYTGVSGSRVDVYKDGGGHPRHYDGKAEDMPHQIRSAKHRYVYLVGDKRTKRRMLKELRYPIIKQYPKGDEIRYNTESPKPVIPLTVIPSKTAM